MINKKYFWILITILTIIEQGIKLVINSSYLHTNIPILEPWIYFKPMFNRDYSWFNSMLQLGLGKWIHITLVVVIILFIFLFYKFLNHQSETTRLVDTAFGFILSGALCSLIDKVFWDGSLDYIQLRGLFTFDLKDVYINVFIGLLLLMIITDHKGIREADDKDVLKDFVSFILGK